MLIISLLIVIIFFNGDRTKLRVSEFSWQDKQIGVQENYFTLSFNRSVNQESVEQNLQIQPPLNGKISWSGRNLVYSLAEYPIYGQTYQVKLENSIPLEKEKSGKVIEPFLGQFKTRDRIFAYLGIKGKEKGRLILYNLTKQTPIILTPPDLIVMDFKFYPQGDKILFSAFGRSQKRGIEEQQLYTVTTGINFQATNNSQPRGRIQKVLDAKDYHNLQFDLSADGKTIVVERINRNNRVESSLWIISQSGELENLGIPGNDFLIAPDGKTLAVVQPQGITIVPLSEEEGAWPFLPRYESILAFSADNKRKVMVKDNQDYTRSLFIITNEGVGKELFRSIRPIIGCKFEPRQEKILYCLKTDLVEEEGQYYEEPSLAAIDLETGSDIPLLGLPNYRDVKMSMSPDGLDLLFDQVVTISATSSNDVITEGGEAITAGRVWLLKLPNISTTDDIIITPPTELFSGFNPQWLP